MQESFGNNGRGLHAASPRPLRPLVPVGLASRSEHNSGPVRTMAVNTAGIFAVAVFYLIILLVGVFAAWKQRRSPGQSQETIMLAKRNIGMFVGVLTVTGSLIKSCRV